MVRVLLAANATVNTQDKVAHCAIVFLTYTCFVCGHLQDGHTPLWAASFHGHQICAQLLIEAGAHVNAPKQVRLPIKQVPYNGNFFTY